jgi:hypothetical protein
MSLYGELQDLAQQLVGAGWQSKPEIDWTPDEHATYTRWARAERLRLHEETGGRVSVRRVTVEEIEHERRTLVGAVLRPTRLTLDFTGERLLVEGPDATILLPIKHDPPDPGEAPHG